MITIIPVFCILSNKYHYDKNSFLFWKLFSLDYTCLTESGVSAVFIDGFDCAGGEVEADRFLQFRYVDFLWLHVDLAATLAGRIKLRRTSAV